MISDVRTYFKSRVTEELSKAIEHEDAFNLENIALRNGQVKYHIAIGSIGNIETHGDRVTDSIEIELSLVKKGYLKTQDNFFDFIDNLQNIKLRASNQRNYNSGIKLVVCNSITVDGLDTNDNIFQATLSFSVRMDSAVI